MLAPDSRKPPFKRFPFVLSAIDYDVVLTNLAMTNWLLQT
ncbi:hypothetical protein YPPY15_0481 [Yersinia pestis PY-15]|nr:hypothetical protein YPPY06_0483 [Yersinia pestis PY-06]EIR52598.1 hypothetical protein YPPY15_0481 [Yersinia pestis PY-15]EIS50735.1 hypothetical protein YPPY59_0504 [Yersinia pestis PY-59]